MGNDLSASAWHSLCLHLTLQTLPQIKLSWTFDLLRTESQDSGKRSATQSHCLVTWCVWSMMLSRNTAGVYPRKSPVPSARGPPNWRKACVADRGKLSCKVVLGIMPVSDSVFLASPFKARVQGENALCMRESVTKRVRVIGGFSIALTTNFKCAAHVSGFPMSKHTWHFLHLRVDGAFQNTVITLSVGQIHIYKWQPGSILCLQQPVQSSKLNSATQLSLTECWISERICILEKKNAWLVARIHIRIKMICWVENSHGTWQTVRLHNSSYFRTGHDRETVFRLSEKGKD